MSLLKFQLPELFYQPVKKNREWVMKNFSRVCVSFLAVKIQQSMLHLTAQHARRAGKKICVLFT